MQTVMGIEHLEFKQNEQGDHVESQGCFLIHANTDNLYPDMGLDSWICADREGRMIARTSSLEMAILLLTIFWSVLQ